MADAICTACGADKDVPLARCGRCGHLPEGPDRELAVLASTRVLDAAGLAEVRRRIERGERLNPSEALRARAREALLGTVVTEARFSAREVAALVVGNVVLTPLLGWAVWMRYRTRPGPAGRQAMLATAPVSVALAVAWWVVSSRT